MKSYLKRARSQDMDSYLGLIPLSAQAHKKENRMTFWCIFLAVFLVTAICGMADMEVRSQRIRLLKDYGYWHIRLSGITDEEAALVSMRPEVEAMVWYDALNYRLDQDYFLFDRPAVICGYGEGVEEMMGPSIPFEAGGYPAGPGEAALSRNAGELYGLSVGDEVTLSLPDGVLRCRISGFTQDTGMLMSKDAVGVVLTREDQERITPEGRDAEAVWYVRLSERGNLRKSVEGIRKSLDGTGGAVAENSGLLGVSGGSSDPSMQGLMVSALLLFLLVLTAGVLMISGAMNSNVTRRTEFFGLLRCLGASRRQVMAFVRREALGWCRKAIPAGLAAGTLIIWALCALLAMLSPTYFGDMPRFAVSPAAWVSGTAVGILTVLLAAGAPAKRAARVSPLTAVSGGSENGAAAVQALGTGWFGVEISVGIGHAFSGRRSASGKHVRPGGNLFLLGGSFAFSIILFLAFAVLLQFMRHAVNPLKPYAPDLSVVSRDNGRIIDGGLPERLEEFPGVERAYGRAFAYGLGGVTKEGETEIDLISYEKYQFGWAEEDLLEGSLDFIGEEAAGGEKKVLLMYDAARPSSVGERIRLRTPLGEEEVVVAGILSKIPFDASPGGICLICSEEAFRALTGDDGLTCVDVQLSRSATDGDVERIREAAGEGVLFSDKRLNNGEVRGAFWSFALFVYGFLAIIALITILNIVNSIAMSVNARMKQYGAMRAIGMSCVQLEKMVLAEALTYALGGSAAGGVLGLWIHRVLFDKMVTGRWGSPWEIPWEALAMIVALVLVSSAAAVCGPAGRIRGMSIVETIAEK